MTGRDPGDLQFQIALVAPEPRHLFVGCRPGRRDGAATQRPWSTAFCTNSRRTRPGAKGVGKLAQSPIAEIAGSPVDEVFVDDDAVVDREPGVAGEFGVGDDADADQDEIGGEDAGRRSSRPR